MGKKYGGGTKYKAIWGRMVQIKENARLINEAIAHGIDPISVELTDAPSRNPKEGQGSYVAVLIQSLLAQHDSASPLNLTLSQLILMFILNQKLPSSSVAESSTLRSGPSWLRSMVTLPL